MDATERLPERIAVLEAKFSSFEQQTLRRLDEVSVDVKILLARDAERHGALNAARLMIGLVAAICGAVGGALVHWVIK